MSLNLTKLQNVVKSTNGEVQARCPACAAAGLDTKGEHLKIFADGKYACAANQGDKGHSKEIFKLAGVSELKAIVGNVPVKTFQVPASTVIMDLGQFCRFARKPRDAGAA